jgi:thiamine-monophosphate kinase
MPLMTEFQLLAKLRERGGTAHPRVLLGSGDDAAITVPEGATATSVDAIVEGVHFRRREASLAEIGRRGLAAGLSDLAAMGAEAGEAYVVIGVPPDLDEDGCMALFDGIEELALATGTTLAGGDVVRAPVLILAFTVVGHAPEAASMVTRAGARDGDLLVLTGEIGGAAAGRSLGERPELGGLLPAEIEAALRSRSLRPEPRLAAGAALARAGATAMIDLSDGLGADAAHVGDAGGVLLSVDAAAVPLQAGVAEVAAAAGEDPIEFAFSGGEDYELLACLPSGLFERARAEVETAGTSLSAVGAVGPGRGAEVRLPDGGRLEPSGFDQLR